MKLSCVQENLSRALGVVTRAVAARTTLPITSNVLLATDEGRLKLSATNLEIALSCWVGAKVEEEGAITVPARLLTEFIGTLPNENVDMSLSGSTLELRCARFNARISGMDADDFPPIPKVSDGINTRIEADVFHTAVSRVEFAAATEDTRPVLTGIYAEFDGDRLTLAAADGFRLAVYKASLATPVSEKTEIIIPARALAELNRFVTDQTEPVEVVVNSAKSQVLFRLKNLEMVSQLVQGSFPNYSQLIPQSHTTQATIDTAEFLRATRSASIFARGGSGIVRLEVEPGGAPGVGKVKVSARAEEMGDNEGEMDAVVEGGEAKIAFNSKYLTDVLSVLDEERVALEVTNPSSPGVIRPLGSDGYIHVVMPMFVQW
ncbi:MAG: DNA polymerase III subunit beta [Dehalococcoidia bacterium]